MPETVPEAAARAAATVPEAAARAAVKVAASLGIACIEPVVLADGANVIVHLSPSPVVAKVAASTPAVRPDVAAWLQRELDVASFLARAGVPVAEPSPLVPATTHHGDGQVMSFWRYLPLRDAGRPGEETIGSMLRDLHAALRDYPGSAPVLAPLQDIPAFLARPQSRIDTSQHAALAAAYTRLTAELDPAAPQQPLHGDAGAGNLSAANEKGWVWHDFEDTCTGPMVWDLAATTANPRLDRSRILAAYGTAVDSAQLAVCQQLRRLHLTIWYALYAERLPDLRPRSADLLTEWPAP